MKTNDKPSPGLLKSRPLIFSAIAIALITLLAIVFVPEKDNTAETAYYTAKRGDFLISVVEGGSLDAVKEVRIRSEVEGSARVISIVPEGTYVKEGDLLVELDSGAAEDKKNQQEIAVRKAELAVTNAFEVVNIGQSQTNSDITAAVISRDLAELDLLKYMKGEMAQTRREFELDIETANADRILAEQTFHFSEDLFKNDFETKAQTDRDEISWKKAEKAWINATNALWMFEEFDREKLKTQYESAVQEALKDLDRVIFKSRAKIVQEQADLLTQQRTLELNKEKLARDIKNVEGCIITAPSDGLVVYATGESRFSSESMIEEGATVRYRQSLIKLPDISSMKLALKIHESHIANIKVGMPAYIVLDPMPEKRFMGSVTKVGILPDSQSRWGNPNLKVYSTEITITDPLPPNIKPGVSAKAEILITQLKDVIAIPVQAVTTWQGKSVVYVVGNPSPVPVDVGMFNTKKIEIVSGIKVGDRVLLSPPLDSGESSIDGSILEEGADIELTNQVAIAKTADGPSTAKPKTEKAEQEGDAKRPSGGFDRKAMMKNMLKKYDKDGDGELSDTEKATMRKEMQSRFGSGSRGGGSRGEGGERRSSGGRSRESGSSH